MKKAITDESFARNEERYRDFCKRLADSIWAVDANTLKILFISDFTQNLRGYSLKEVIGSYLREITTDDSYQMAMIELTEARREYEKGRDPVPKLEIECYNKQSTTTWIEIAAKFMQEEGEPLQLVGIARDISDRKSAEMNRKHLLKMYMEELTEETRLRSDLELLEKLLPICSRCRRVRDDKNEWWPLETYVREKTDTRLTTTLCPNCKKVSCSKE